MKLKTVALLEKGIIKMKIKATRNEALKIANKIISDYKEHYDFPPQGESHMHDCIMSEFDTELIEEKDN